MKTGLAVCPNFNPIVPSVIFLSMQIINISRSEPADIVRTVNQLIKFASSGLNVALIM